MAETPEPPDPGLVTSAESFAQQLSELLVQTIADEPPIQAAVVGDRISVTIGAPDTATTALPLYVGGAHKLDLRLRYLCTWDFSGEFLAIDKSEFAVLFHGDRDPLFRFDYDRERRWAEAHVQVHAERNLLGHVLGFRSTTKAPTLKSLHLPVGGRRFRPALEDVIEFLIEDMEVQAKVGWQSALRAARETWREIQLAAAIRDVLRQDPARLRDELHEAVDRAYTDVTREPTSSG